MIFSQAWGQLSHGKQMSSLSHENSSRYWQEYKMETSTGTAVIVFICHISMQPHIYCGRYQRAWYIACPTALSKFFQSDPAHPHAPLLHFYKWALSVAAAVSHPRHAEWDATARDIIKVSPEHVGGGGVCVIVTPAIIHKHKQMLFNVIPCQFINVSCCV